MSFICLDALAIRPDWTMKRLNALKASSNPTSLSGARRISDRLRLAGLPEE
jgi:hypothetical protein